MYHHIALVDLKNINGVLPNARYGTCQVLTFVQHFCTSSIRFTVVWLKHVAAEHNKVRL